MPGFLFGGKHEGASPPLQFGTHTHTHTHTNTTHSQASFQADPQDQCNKLCFNAHSTVHTFSPTNSYLTLTPSSLSRSQPEHKMKGLIPAVVTTALRSL